jgi:hypothetical protein
VYLHLPQIGEVPLPSPSQLRHDAWAHRDHRWLSARVRRPLYDLPLHPLTGRYSTLYTIHYTPLYDLPLHPLTGRYSTYTPYTILLSMIYHYIRSQVGTVHYTPYTILLSMIYHYIRSQAFIKLYVVTAMVEITDKLTCSLGTVRYALCTIHYTLCTIHYPLCTIHDTLCTIHHTPCTIRYAPYTMHHTLCTIH